jgi:hypothetical protein
MTWQQGLSLLMALLVVLAICAHAWPLSARKIREEWEYDVAERKRRIDRAARRQSGEFQ